MNERVSLPTRQNGPRENDPVALEAPMKVEPALQQTWSAC